MKLQNQLNGFESGMNGFQTINDILAENWADSNMEAFSANHLAPIAANVMTSIADVQGRLSTIDTAIDTLSEQQLSLKHSIDRSRDPQQSEIEGCLIIEFSTHEEPTGDRSVRHFVLDKLNVNQYGNDMEALKQVAEMKFPYCKDYLDFHQRETITLWGR